MLEAAGRCYHSRDLWFTPALVWGTASGLMSGTVAEGPARLGRGWPPLLLCSHVFPIPGSGWMTMGLGGGSHVLSSSIYIFSFLLCNFSSPFSFLLFFPIYAFSPLAVLELGAQVHAMLCSLDSGSHAV